MGMQLVISKATLLRSTQIVQMVNPTRDQGIGFGMGIQVTFGRMTLILSMYLMKKRMWN